MKYILLLALTGIVACNSSAPKHSMQPPLNADSMKNVLMKTDLDFSNLSKQVGINKSFMAYVHDEGTLLRPNHQPITGKDSIYAYLYSRADSLYQLTWQPVYAGIAASGDLGYTYGTYIFLDKTTRDSTAGTYVSIWKSDAAGNWKYVLDTGNPGLTSSK